MAAKLSMFALLVTAVLAQNLPPRDRAPRTLPEQPAGTGRITGIVVAADNGAPVKRATVSIHRLGPLPGQRGTAPPSGMVTGTITSTGGVVVSGMYGAGGAPSATTDEAGRFEQGELAAGRYVIMVRPQGGFVAPPRPEQVTLADGETLALTIRVDRTGAITGRILDGSGDPFPRVRVAAMRADGGPGGMANGMTDDLGQFRLFDLAPGDYHVSAAPTQFFTNESAGSPGYATTYFPGTASRDQAQRVTVTSGRDTPAVDFWLTRVALGRITGSLRDANGQLVAFDPREGGRGSMASVTLTAVTASGTDYMASRGAPVRPDGSFVLAGVPPGNYYLNATITRGPGPEAPREGAFVPVTVNGDEQQVHLRANLGATISGRIVVEGTRPPSAAGVRMPSETPVRPRVMIRSVPGGPSQTAVFTPDAGQANEAGEFELQGVRGHVFLTASPTSGTAVLKSITYGPADLSTRPIELKGTERLRNVLVTFTHETGRIEGTVVDGPGPALGASILIFPDDEDKWFAGAPYVQMVRSMSEMPPDVLASRPPGARPPPAPGSFVSRPMLPGRYYVIALAAESSGMVATPRDAAGFHALTKGATIVTVSVDGAATVQLRLRRPGAVRGDR